MPLDPNTSQVCLYAHRLALQALWAFLRWSFSVWPRGWTKARGSILRLTDPLRKVVFTHRLAAQALWAFCVEYFTPTTAIVSQKGTPPDRDLSVCYFRKRYDALAEWLRRSPAKGVGSARESSNPSGVVFVFKTQVWGGSCRISECYLTQLTC